MYIFFETIVHQQCKNLYMFPAGLREIFLYEFTGSLGQDMTKTVHLSTHDTTVIKLYTHIYLRKTVHLYTHHNTIMETPAATSILLSIQPNTT